MIKHDQLCGYTLSGEIMNEKIAQLRKKAMALPLEPGVYIMKDKSEKIIYIGKAKALKNRVSQYFGSPRNHSDKVRRMVENVDHFEYIITSSEFEALVLECSLIKQHKPKYNILLKDDKGYAFIKITRGNWGRITAEKNNNDQTADYLGPYMSHYYVKNAVDQAQKIFKIPNCSKVFPRDFGKSRPCLNFYIKQCSAPCTGKVSIKEYNENFSDAVEFLKNGGKASIKKLTDEMNEAAERLEFEKAAKIRDRINAVKRMGQRQRVVESNVKNQDVIALACNGENGCFEVFRFADGSLYDRENFIIKDIEDTPKARAEFIERYYQMRTKIPPRITLDSECEDAEILQQWLSEQCGKKVTINVPQIGEQLKLVQMCKNNAAEHIAQKRGITAKEEVALSELAAILGLSQSPDYIESYDISNLMGSENVAGMIVFKKGRPYRKAYRKFKIKSFAGQDDYASMQEVIRRRFEEYEKHRNDDNTFGVLPDLILLDGGKGQHKVVMQVLREMNIDVPVFGMVKDSKHKTRAITDGDSEIEISSNRSAFTLVSTIQEEVHRFAITYHRESRKKATFKSSLTDIEGIGEKRAKALLKHFGSIKNIKSADLEELLQAPNMNSAAANAVYNYFH